MFNKRFETIYSKGAFGSQKILVDMKTGVNYLYASNGIGIGVTVMLDSDGKPVITKKEILNAMQQRTWWERIFK